jgi:DNA-binding MarR family transcriptional regulator
MSTDFDKIALFGSYIAKNYAPDILRVLYTYRDVSASEAASRLGLHINTVQDFLEAMYQTGFTVREEVYEKKRPYYRYKLASELLKIEINLADLFLAEKSDDITDMRIREKANSFATFNQAKNNLFFSSVVILTGEGRDRRQKRINLTTAQGKFLYNLPFPDGQFQRVTEIIKRANIPAENLAEIMDIVKLLIEYDVIEKT